MTNTATLRIRYAHPDTTPSDYTTARLPKEYEAGYWTLRGSETLLRAHVNAALAANDLNDYDLDLD